ncbi:hypothetical protein ACFQWC_12425 [Rossellomorea sp. GCM10028870]|uniref:hypothetical protein n=1 Tax=Rossellomorea sp. GCM10028870 TaxID=3273426 RepID=UPI003617D654
MDLESYEKVSFNYWEEFINDTNFDNAVYIFECCFLQNPFTKFIAKHNAGVPRLEHHLSKIGSLINPEQAFGIKLESSPNGLDYCAKSISINMFILVSGLAAPLIIPSPAKMDNLRPLSAKIERNLLKVSRCIGFCCG